MFASGRCREEHSVPMRPEPISGASGAEASPTVRRIARLTTSDPSDRRADVSDGFGALVKFFEL
jgi:hypothetical protein